MTQQGPLLPGSREALKEMPSLGIYSIYEHRGENDVQEQVKIYCRSEGVPLGMDIRFPDQKTGLTDEGDSPNLEDPAYTLRWLSGVSTEGVVQIIREVGEDLDDEIYLCQPSQNSAPIDLMGMGLDLDEILCSDFKLLAVRSSDFRLFWQGERITPNSGPQFILEADSQPVIDPGISDIVRKTVPPQYIDHVPASLENLAAIFEKFRNGPSNTPPN